MMTFCDTHTHLYDPEAYGFPDGCADAVRRAVSSGVSTLILPDCSSAQREMMFSLAGMFPDVCHPCIGLHPTEFTAGNWKDELDKVLELSGRKDIVAIGEIGMDLYWSKELLEEQKEVFERQLVLAEETSLPVIIHNREATAPILEILRRHKGLRGVFHAYSGSIETWREISSLGDWFIGVGGVLTFKKASIAETVKNIPLSRILLETDSPYLTPAPHRGERNESAYIPLIAQRLSELTGVPVEEIAAQTTQNARNLFAL